MPCLLHWWYLKVQGTVQALHEVLRDSAHVLLKHWSVWTLQEGSVSISCGLTGRVRIP